MTQRESLPNETTVPGLDPAPPPAFGSNRTAKAYCLIVLGIFALPWVLNQLSWIDSTSRFDRVSGSANIANEVFHNSSDIDILFIGNSPLIVGVDTPFIQESLSRHLGRPATVLTLGVIYSGKDLVYSILNEVIQRRRIGLLIIQMNDITIARDEPHVLFPRWWRVGENPELFSLLDFSSRIKIYAGSMLTGGLIATDHVFSQDIDTLENPTLGMKKTELGYKGRAFESLALDKESMWREFSGSASILRNWEGETRGAVRYTGARIRPFQAKVARQMGHLLRSNGVTTAILSLPHRLDAGLDHVSEPRDWSVVFKKSVALIGIPGQELFSGMTPTEIDRFYYDDRHLNRNGNEYFTRAIINGLFLLYDQANS